MIDAAGHVAGAYAPAVDLGPLGRVPVKAPALLLDGLAIRFSMGAFGLIVDHTVVLVALLAGLVLGLVGALPPAVRCLRMPIPEALKAA